MFDLSTGFWAIDVFRKSLPDHHVDHISQVNVSFTGGRKVPGDPSGKGQKNEITKFWPVLWESLAAMKNLRWLRFEIRLTIYVTQIGYWQKNRDHILRPITLVTQPSYFELILPFDVGDRAKELPCHVIRVETKEGSEY